MSSAIHKNAFACMHVLGCVRAHAHTIRQHRSAGPHAYMFIFDDSSPAFGILAWLLILSGICMLPRAEGLSLSPFTYQIETSSKF